MERPTCSAYAQIPPLFFLQCTEAALQLLKVIESKLMALCAADRTQQNFQALRCQSQLPDRGDLKEQSGSDCTPSHAFCGLARDHKVNNLHMTSFDCRHWWMLWRTGPL
jgi:hypothetical protein